MLNGKDYIYMFFEGVSQLFVYSSEEIVENRRNEMIGKGKIDR